MKLIRNVFIVSLIGLCALVFGSCKKSEDERGPMEKAGKAIDQAAEKAQEQMGKALEKTGEALKEGGEKIRESGEKARN